jgi:hypothetical protein
VVDVLVIKVVAKFKAVVKAVKVVESKAVSWSRWQRKSYSYVLFLASFRLSSYY